MVIYKRVSLYLLFLLPINNWGQDTFAASNIKLNNLSSIEPIAAVDNELNIHLFFVPESNYLIEHVKYDFRGNLIFQEKYKSPQQKYPRKHGVNVNENNSISLYFSNKKNTKFHSTTLPRNKGEKIENNLFEFNEKNEKFLCTTKRKNIFYIFSYLKKTSIINKYAISNNNISKTSYDLSNQKFYNRDNEQIVLANIFKNNPVQPIEEDIPNSIEIVSSKLKLYVKDKEIIVTLNHRKIATRILRLSNKSDNFDVEFVNIPTGPFLNDGVLKSNSFLYKEKIYQFLCSKERIYLSANHLNSKELIKDYLIGKDEDFNIINSAIIQEGGAYAFGATRELQKTKQFLRKISNSERVGIHAFTQGGKINLSIGGNTQIGSSGFNRISNLPTTTTTTTPYGNITYLTPVYQNFSSYSATRSVYVKCLFAEVSFKHLDGNPSKHIFDRVSDRIDFLKETKQVKKLKFETIFKYDNVYMHGYYDKKAREYHLEKYF